MWCFCIRKVTTSYLGWHTDCSHWGLVCLFQSLQANALTMPRIRPLFVPFCSPFRLMHFWLFKLDHFVSFSRPFSLMFWWCPKLDHFVPFSSLSRLMHFWWLKLDHFCALPSLQANSCMMRQIRPLMCRDEVTGEWKKQNNEELKICTPYPILCGW
jgi:hypothetical protein